MSTTEQLCARVYYHAGTNVIISSRFSIFGIISVFVFLKTKVWSELELKSQNTKPDEFYLHYPHGDVYVDTKVCALCCIFVYEYQTVKACFPVKRTRLVMNTWWWSLFFFFFLFCVGFFLRLRLTLKRWWNLWLPVFLFDSTDCMCAAHAATAICVLQPW